MDGEAVFDVWQLGSITCGVGALVCHRYADFGGLQFKVQRRFPPTRRGQRIDAAGRQTLPGELTAQRTGGFDAKTLLRQGR